VRWATAGLVPVADLAAIAQRQCILLKIRYPEVVQVTRGIVELAGPAFDVGPIVFPKAPRRYPCHLLDKWGIAPPAPV
jgi:hypothetical protein